MRLTGYLQDRKKGRQLLLMAHAVAGYPSLEDNWRMLECMQEAGVDLVELQMPFSEPIADGPVFIRANQEALARGLRWRDYFDFMTRAAAQFSFPLLFMGYYNNVFRMGHAAFCKRLADAGGRGYIVADLPPEEAGDLAAAASPLALSAIHIMTPASSDERLREIAREATGFVYCVARRGVTGRSTRIDQEVRDYINRCRRVTPLPIALGFGIRLPEHVAGLRGIADIAIVGTAGLEAWEQGGAGGYGNFLKSLAAAAA